MASVFFKGLEIRVQRPVPGRRQMGTRPKTVKEFIMPPSSFRAMVVEEIPGQGFVRRIRNKKIHDLPEGDVLIKVHYSSLN
jgi:hypothetical protein